MHFWPGSIWTSQLSSRHRDRTEKRGMREEEGKGRDGRKWEEKGRRG